jgi:hypothetical protein
METKPNQQVNWISGSNYVSFTLHGAPYRILESDARFGAVMKALSEKDIEALEVAVVQTQDQAIMKMISIDGMTATTEGVVFKGVQLHGVVVEKIKSLMQNGFDANRVVYFLRWLQDNSSSSSVLELYDFMSYKELPITPEGYLIAYKGVGADGYSINGDLETIVLQGHVDSSGRILNNVGATIQVLRHQVDDNRNHGCSRGLHVGSWDYAQHWAGPDGKVLTVRVNPKDVVSVPIDCQHQKMRVCEYEVLDSVTSEIESPAYEDEGESLMEYCRATASGIDGGNWVKGPTIDQWLNESLDLGAEVTVQNILNSFSLDVSQAETLVRDLQDYDYSVSLQYGQEITEAIVSLL